MEFPLLRKKERSMNSTVIPETQTVPRKKKEKENE